MFSIRFEMHQDKYEMFSCVRYNVSTERCQQEEKDDKPEDAPLRKVVRMFKSDYDDNPYYETIGDREPYAMAYIMNANGQTVDRIRA